MFNFVCLFGLAAYWRVGLFVCFLIPCFVCLTGRLTVRLSVRVCLCVCLFVFVCLFVLFICLFAHLRIGYWFVCLPSCLVFVCLNY